MVVNILDVSEVEGKGTRRTPVAGGQRQPAAPYVPAAAMKSIPPAVQRKEEGKGRPGRTGAGAAEGGDSEMRTGGRGWTGKGGKGQVGAPGAKKVAGHHEGKGGKGGGQGINGRNASIRLSGCCRGRRHRSAQRCGQRR